MSTTTLNTLIHGIVAVAIIAAVTTLLALHDISEATAISLYGVAVVLVGGTLNTALALKVPVTQPGVTQPGVTTPQTPAP